MDDKTTQLSPPPAADEHAGEPDKGPGPTPDELAERAAGKATENAPDADRAAAIARLAHVAELVANGQKIDEPLTDAEAETLKAAGINVARELEAAAEWYERHQAHADGELASMAKDEDDDAPARVPTVLDGLDEPTLDRLHAMCMADGERRAAGLTLIQRVQAVVDGPHAAGSLSAMLTDGLDEAGLGELARIAGAMGWAVDTSATAEHQVAILKK